MKRNYPYIGDHPAESPSVSDCEFCDGFGFIDVWTNRRDWQGIPCEHCTPDEPDPEPDVYPD